jgi:hypothetical protein
MSHTKESYYVSFAVTAALLVVVTYPLVSWSASEEPFYGATNISDGLLSVGLGSIVAFLWITWGIGLLAASIYRKVNPACLFAMTLPAAALFFLQFVVIGYLHDQAAFYQMAVEKPTATQSQVIEDGRDKE